ncbi:MAG: hypothetical protein M3295_03320 [Chloroflexota bacterium]|nr:hypothetical protein [Chloroflexota bacterium]
MVGKKSDAPRREQWRRRVFGLKVTGQALKQRLGGGEPIGLEREERVTISQFSGELVPRPWPKPVVGPTTDLCTEDGVTLVVRSLCYRRQAQGFKLCVAVRAPAVRAPHAIVRRVGRRDV